MLDKRVSISDPLSYALASLSWSTWRAGVLRQRAPWGVQVADGHASFYAVRQGEAWLTSPHWPAPVRLQTGDIALIPRGSGHRLQDSPDNDTAEHFDQLADGLNQDEQNGNGQANVTCVIYGYTAGNGSGANPLHAHLSTLIQLNVSQYAQLQQMESLFAIVETEHRQQRPGWQAIVKQLVQVMFYQSLRAFITCSDHQTKGNVDATQSVVADPAIGLVVGLLHSQPGDPWTVASLARWVNMSRSAFSERFRDVVGQPPLHYLTELRMSRACHLLESTDLGVKQVAAIVGYESPSSFTNAFKRWHGVSPASYRDHSVSQLSCGGS
jgi:AraC-like DNA-binding protein